MQVSESDYKQSLRGFIWLMLLWAVLGVVACGESASTSAQPISDGDDHPEDGDIMVDGDDIVVDGDIGGVVGVQLEPPGESGFPIQQKVSIDLEHFSGEIVLDRSVTYEGEVRMPDGASPEDGATLIFSYADSAGMIAGHPLPNITTNTSVPGMRAGQALFSLSLLPGLYTLYVFPGLADSVPPIIRNGDLYVGESGMEVLWFERGLPLSGVITDADGNGLPGVKVTAYSASPWLRSSVAISSDAVGEEGFFTLNMLTRPGAYRLVFSPSDSNPLLPTLSVNNVVNVADNTLEPVWSEIKENRMVFAYEPFEQRVCRISGVVRGRSEAGLTALKGVRIVYSSSYIGGGSYSVSATTDDAGAYSLNVLATSASEEMSADDYKVSVLPPVSSDFAARYVSNVDCAGDALEKSFDLDPRLIVSGIITGAGGVPVEQAEIVAQKKLTTSTPNEYESNVYAKSTFSDADGAYSLALDAGAYDFVFIPPEGSGLARAFLRDIETSTDGVVNQSLYAGKRFVGYVVDADGAPVPYVYLQVYRDRPTSGVAEPIGNGSSDGEGRFEIVIP